MNMDWSQTSSSALAINTGNSIQIFLSQGINFYVDSQVLLTTF